MLPTSPASAETIRLARALSARIAVERPDLLNVAADLLDRLSPIYHGPDFSSVVWYGTPYEFTPRQALAVECLWKAWERGGSVSKGDLLNAARTRKVRIVDLFKDHPAWGAMIRWNNSGFYRLAPPEPPQSG